MAKASTKEVAATVVEVGTIAPIQNQLTQAEWFAATLKAYLAKFEPNLADVNLGIRTLEALKITDQASRDAAYEITVSCNKAKKLIEVKRLLVLVPLKELTKGLNDYAETKLDAPLTAAMKRVTDLIITFDKEEKKKRDDEAARLKKLADEKAAEEAAAAKKRQDDADAEKKRIDDEAAALVAKASAPVSAGGSGLTGIARAKALCEAEEKRLANLTVAEAKAAQVETTAQIDASLGRADIKNQLEDIEGTKAKGLTENWDFEVLDISKMPDIYLKKEVMRKETLIAIKAGTRQIAGLRIFQKDGLTLR